MKDHKVPNRGITNTINSILRVFLDAKTPDSCVETETLLDFSRSQYTDSIEIDNFTAFFTYFSSKF